MQANASVSEWTHWSLSLRNLFCSRVRTDAPKLGLLIGFAQSKTEQTGPERDRYLLGAFSLDLEGDPEDFA